MHNDAIIYCENEFGKIDGKVANGLVRKSEKYNIVGVIDSTKSGLDAGHHLDGIKIGIPIFSNCDEAIISLNSVPKYFIYGIAALASHLNKDQRSIIISAMKKGLNIVNGLPEFFSEDPEFMQHATENNIKIFDIRKPPKRKDLHSFTGKIMEIKTPIITIFGTDCAVGKRTSTVKIVTALNNAGLNAVFIATGQTGILQGAKYGIALDVLSSGFATGEVEHAILTANKQEQPDIIVVEGQGALSHPSFTSSAAILRGALPKAVIVQHPPKRKDHCDFDGIPMPSLESEIKLIEVFSDTKVIAITINHENMNDDEIENTIIEYEGKYQLPTSDVLKHGCDKLIRSILEFFPQLQSKVDEHFL